MPMAMVDHLNGSVYVGPAVEGPFGFKMYLM